MVRTGALRHPRKLASAALGIAVLCISISGVALACDGPACETPSLALKPRPPEIELGKQATALPNADATSAPDTASGRPPENELGPANQLAPTPQSRQFLYGKTY